MMEKIVCIENYKIGNEIINFYCEFYNFDYILSGGVKAANGWHQEPKTIIKYDKKPFMAKVMTKDEVERLAKKYNYIIEYIQ